MTLQFKLDTESFNGLDDAQKGLYEQNGDNYQLKIEGLPEQEDVTGLKNKVDQLLTEKKQAQQKASEEAEIERKKAIEEAKKRQDFESLYNSQVEVNNNLKAENEKILSGISKDRLQAESMKIAAELADGSNQELLSTFISQRLRFEDGAVKVLDKTGGLTVSSLSDLKNEFASDDKFKSLLRGNLSGGGGAAPTSGGAAQGKQIKRSDFDSMKPNEQMAFAKEKGNKIID